MDKELLEVLGKNIRYKKEYVGNDTYRLYIKKNEIELLENYLTELEQIKNANTSEALECLEKIDDMFYLVKYRTTENGNHEEYEFYPSHTKEYDTIQQALLKAQEQEAKIGILKEKNKEYLNRLEKLENHNLELEKVLEIIKEKGLPLGEIDMIKQSNNYEEYIIKFSWANFKNISVQKTQEEFEMLKECVENGK